MVEGVWVQLLEVQGPALVILVLSEYNQNELVASVVLAAFDNTSSLNSPPCRVIYPPGSNLVNYLQFPCGE